MFLKWTLRVAVTLVLIVAAILVWDFAKKKILGFDTPPPPVITHNTTLEQIEAMGKLELVKYKFKDILEYEVKKSWWRDSKAVLIISGEAVGCIDLSKIKPENIIEKDSVVLIELPKPELCYVKVNHQESKLYDMESGVFGSGEGKIVSDAYKAAEEQIQKTALESNILEQTKKNAELILKPTLEQIAKKKVIFRYDLSKTKIEKENKRLK
ncbi:MAG: DUF4230 domain-containing protein [Thermonemataceae bacterium]|nr:DUF4230 domain-containing protein [Thermonemataceae bacterium]